MGHIGSRSTRSRITTRAAVAAAWLVALVMVGGLAQAAPAAPAGVPGEATRAHPSYDAAGRAAARPALTARPGVVGPGQPVRLETRIRGRVRRPVVLQRAQGRKWVKVARRKTTRKGRVAFRTVVPRDAGPRSHRYRVLAPRTKVRGTVRKRVVTRVRAVSVPAPPVVTTTALPPVVAGLDYSVALAAQGPAAGTWSATGPLGGLALTPGGVLSGRPMSAGTFTFPVTFRDTFGQSGTRVLSLEVLPPRWRGVDNSAAAVCGVRTDDTAWCWGEGGEGQVGDGSVLTPRPTPARVQGAGWVQVDTSGWTTCGVQRDGSGWCWGDNGAGTVGDGTTTDRPSPTRLPGGGWSRITVDHGVACGIKDDASAWCWGYDLFGQVGTGGADSRVPAQLPGSWASVQVGDGTTCGVRTDATGWCWGLNHVGQVGDGSFANRTAPVALPGSWRTVTPGAVSIGDTLLTTTCGVRADGTGWCWGAGEQGQVGDGAMANRTSPVSRGAGWSSMSSRDGTTCGVKADGTAWCWGEGGFGQTGLGGTSDLATPAVLAITGWASIRPGLTSCGVRTDGTGWCWGRNNAGQVGDASTSDRALPRLLPGTGWVSIRPERLGTCGMRSDGSAWCWGANNSGQVGDGTLANRTTPYPLP